MCINQIKAIFFLKIIVKYCEKRKTFSYLILEQIFFIKLWWRKNVSVLCGLVTQPFTLIMIDFKISDIIIFHSQILQFKEQNVTSSVESWVDGLNGRWTPLLFLVLGVFSFVGQLYVGPVACNFPPEFTESNVKYGTSRCFTATDLAVLPFESMF